MSDKLDYAIRTPYRCTVRNLTTGGRIPLVLFEIIIALEETYLSKSSCQIHRPPYKTWTDQIYTADEHAIQTEAREAIANNAAASGSDHRPVDEAAGAGPGAVNLARQPKSEAVSSTSLQTAPPRACAAVMRHMLQSPCSSMAWPPCKQIWHTVCAYRRKP